MNLKELENELSPCLSLQPLLCCDIWTQLPAERLYLRIDAPLKAGCLKPAV